jgi:hypothetical protein
MASLLKVDALTGVTTAGSISVTGEGNSTTTNLQQGLAKAWIFSPATSASITDSFNISSITDGGTGEQDMTFTSAMNNANYSSVVIPETVNAGNTGAGVRVAQVHSKTTLLIDARADYTTSGGLYYGGYEGSIKYNMSSFGDLA